MYHIPNLPINDRVITFFYRNYFMHYFKIILFTKILNYVYDRLRNLIVSTMMIIFNILETFILSEFNHEVGRI